MTNYPGLPDNFDKIIDELMAEAIPILAPENNSPERLNELNLAKQRAIELAEKGRLPEAWFYFVIALYNSKWHERYHAPVVLGTRLRRRGELSTPESLTKFIEDFT